MVGCYPLAGSILPCGFSPLYHEYRGSTLSQPEVILPILSLSAPCHCFMETAISSIVSMTKTHQHPSVTMVVDYSNLVHQEKCMQNKH